jgi:hypothetical protein
MASVPTVLSLSEVHAALADDFDHRTEIDRSIADGEARVAEPKATFPSKVTEKLAKLAP